MFIICQEKKEAANKITIKNPLNQEIWKEQWNKNGSFNYLTDQQGVYSLCIKNTDNNQLTASFDFFDEKKDQQLISISKIILVTQRKC